MEPRLVGGVGQEYPYQLDDVLAAEDQTRVAAARVELGELLAQQRDQQAHGVAELAAWDEARDFRLSLARGRWRR